MNKKEIRNNIIENRNKISLEQRKFKDNLIVNKLLTSAMYKESTNIFTFVNYGSEVETKSFIYKALEDSKRIFIPKTIRKTKEMKAVEIISLNNLKIDNFGILEPDTFEGEINKQCLDLIIVPGVVFDRFGNRIGYGGGYYDRYFSDLNPKIKKVALAYDMQLIEAIDAQEHDIKVDFIITEKEIIKI